MSPEIVAAGLTDFQAANASLLAWMHTEAGAACWDVSTDEFSAALYVSATKQFGSTLPPAPALEGYLRGLHLADLALACALRRGSETAWTEFITQYRPPLYAAARAIVGSAGEVAARDLTDSLYAELYGFERPAGSRRPLLDYFHGRSKLTTWLRTVLAQRFVDSLRATQRLRPLEPGYGSDDGARPRVSRPETSSVPDPGALDRERLIPHLRRAFARSLAALPPDDRLLLCLYYVRELTLVQIARPRGVHEATISRRIERLRRELRTSTERALRSGRAGHGGLSAAEVQLCLNYALEDWPFDLSSQLFPNASSPNEGDS